MTPTSPHKGDVQPVQPAEIERLEDELAHVRAEFQEFVHTVSHDLRAPLRHINAFAQVIAEDLPDAPPDILGHLATIRQSAQLLAQQLDGLTMLSRLGQQAVQRQPVDVSALVHSVADALMQQQLGRQVQWQLAQDVPLLWADADLLRQLLTHLLDNALKFSRPREVAHIMLTWQAAPDAPGQCQLTLTDNGVGFAPEQASKLFKVFARLHPARDFEGLGLGLVASRKIVQRLGGRLGITAQLGGGCQVTVTLPVAN